MKTRLRKKDMSVATWNVRSLCATGSLRVLTNELQKYGIGIAAVQETFYDQGMASTFKTSNGFYVYSSCIQERNKEFGTAFIVDGKYNQLVIDFKPINGRMCILRIKGRFFNYSLINVHAPINGSEEHVKETFYDGLEIAYEACPKHDVKIVLGDLNAKIGKEPAYRPTVGCCGVHEVTNENGLRLINFAASRNMVIKSTYFMHKRIYQETWKHPDKITRNQIDHVIIDGRHFSDILNIKARRGANADSDHFLVQIKLRARVSLANNGNRQKLKRIDVEKLKNAESAAKFTRKLRTDLDNIVGLADPSTNVNEKWKLTATTTQDTAADILGYVRPRRNQHWFDDECELVTSEKNEAYQKMLQRSTRATTEDYRFKRKREKRVHKRKKCEAEQAMYNDLERLSRMNETRLYYRKLNSSRKGFDPRVTMIRDHDGNILTDVKSILRRWQEHFDKLLNGDATLDPPPEVEHFPEDGKWIDPPTYGEVKKAIASLKNNKAAGPDSIPAELFKHGGEKLVDVLHNVIVRVWQSEILPTEWMNGALCPLHKKGDKLCCSNYRGICLLNTAYKVFARLLYTRLEPYAEDCTGDYQAGFRADRSTSDQIFAIRQILQKTREFNIETHHLFIDFKAAYDTINRAEMLKIMNELNFPTKLIRLVAATLNGVKCCVKLQGELSPPFETREGLRQGDALSTLLFNITLEGIVRRAGVDNRGTIYNKSTQILAYADDVDIIGRNVRCVKEVYLALERAANNVGLRVNEAKTKYMIASKKSHTEHAIGQNISIGDKNFEVVDEFVYLGALVRGDNDISLEIKRRIFAANRCFSGLRKHLKAKNISRKTKCSMYRTLIKPVLLYGSESWVVLEKDASLLRIFERKVLRTIFGPINENGVFRRRYNFELEAIYGKPDIICDIKRNRLRWFGHIIRMNEGRVTKALFMKKPPFGTRSAGRQRLTWEESVKADLNRLNVQTWTSLAHDRKKWGEILDQTLSTNWM